MRFVIRDPKTFKVGNYFSELITTYQYRVPVNVKVHNGSLTASEKN
ncbi:hypothetical protein ACUY4Q_005032 (plasmid) [Phytobacter sp. AG2a]